MDNSENTTPENNKLDQSQNGLEERREDRVSPYDPYDKEEEKQMSFLDHLEELRWHLIRSLGAIFVFGIAAFLMSDFVWGVLILGPTKPEFWTFQMFCQISSSIGSDAFCFDEMPFVIQSRKMTGQFSMHIVSSAVIGLIIAFPYAFWEIWRFVSPGLYDNERKLSRGAVFFVSLLFMLGILFGYYIVTPISVHFLGNYQVDPTILNEFDITSYVSTMVTLVLACGLLFQLPIVVYFLSKAGIISPEALIKYRKHAIVVMLIIAAVVTPPDPITQMLVAFPLFLLYEASITISKIVVKNQKVKQAEADAKENS